MNMSCHVISCMGWDRLVDDGITKTHTYKKREKLWKRFGGEMQLKCSRAGKQHRIMLCLHQAAGFVWDAQIPAAEPLADLH